MERRSFDEFVLEVSACDHGVWSPWREIDRGDRNSLVEVAENEALRVNDWRARVIQITDEIAT